MDKNYNRREVLTGAGVVMTASLAPNFVFAGNTFEVLMLNKDPDDSKKEDGIFPQSIKSFCWRYRFIFTREQGS